MTVDNVTQILNKIPGDKWEGVMGKGGLDIPRPLLREIQRRYSTDTEKIHACADYYVNYQPYAAKILIISTSVISTRLVLFLVSM